jgi:hypothetical protein
MLVKELLKNIIEKKYDELEISKIDTSNIFWKIKLFEANAIGQIGENLVKEIFKSLNLPLDFPSDKVVHDEYDIVSNGVMIEIKTARKGIKNTYQFNGIEPVGRHYSYIILIGISTTDIKFKIISHKSIRDIHNPRQFFIDFYGKDNKPKSKKLVQMNPGNTVNYKLTLNDNELLPMDFLVSSFEFL